jgi:hypothetical protein
MIKIILELLRIDPFERLYVHEAWEIASKATKKLKLRGAATASKKLRVQQQQAAFKAQGLNYTALQLNSTGSTGRFNQEFGRFRQLGNATEGEPFRSLEAMLTIAYRSGANLTIENGTQKYGTRVKNYGQIVGFRNRADGRRWNAVVPGLKGQLPAGTSLRLKGVQGVVLISGGNHKLMVSLEEPYVADNQTRREDDVRDFIKAYLKKHPKLPPDRVKYLSLAEVGPTLVKDLLPTESKRKATA